MAGQKSVYCLYIGLKYRLLSKSSHLIPQMGRFGSESNWTHYYCSNKFSVIQNSFVFFIED